MQLRDCWIFLLSAVLRLSSFPSFEPFLVQNIYTAWSRSKHLRVRSLPELKTSLLLVPYRNTAVSALFYLERKVWRKFIFPLTPWPPHQLSSPRKTSSATLSCTCIVKLCSAVMTLPLSTALPVKKDQNPLNCKQQLLGHTNEHHRNPIWSQL